MNSLELEPRFKEMGLVDISTFDPSFIIDLKYATENNFVGKVMYNNLQKAYLHPEVAAMLLQSHNYLKQKHPNYRLAIFDAARPISVQKYMFELVSGTKNEQYVANPHVNGGGYHNYGLAVDLTIVDTNRNELDMGSDFDSFDEISHANIDQQLSQNGSISNNNFNNRKLLKEVMSHSGFYQNPFEWWHFQLDFGDKIPIKYKLLDF